MQTQSTNRFVAVLTALLMMLMCIPISPMTLSAEADTTTYVLDAGEFTTKDYFNDTVKAGTDEFFTVKFGNKGAVNENSKTFDDTFTGTKRINMGGNTPLSYDTRVIEFKTTGAADVKVWWVSGGDNRFIHLYNATKATEADATTESVKNSLYISTLSAPEAGTYQIASTEGNNYIYKVEVTPKVTTKDYILDANNLEVSDKVADSSAKAGTEDYFTIYYGNKGQVDTSSPVFDDGYPAAKRINFGGGTTYSSGTRIIEFTAAAGGSAKIWWVSGGDGRYV